MELSPRTKPYLVGQFQSAGFVLTCSVIVLLLLVLYSIITTLSALLLASHHRPAYFVQQVGSTAGGIMNRSHMLAHIRDTEQPVLHLFPSPAEDVSAASFQEQE